MVPARGADVLRWFVLTFAPRTIAGSLALAYGTAAQMPKPVPSTYSFPAGR